MLVCVLMFDLLLFVCKLSCLVTCSFLWTSGHCVIFMSKSNVHSHIELSFASPDHILYVRPRPRQHHTMARLLQQGHKIALARSVDVLRHLDRDHPIERVRAARVPFGRPWPADVMVLHKLVRVRLDVERAVHRMPHEVRP